MPDPKTSPHDSVCQTRGHDCDEVDALRAQVAELEGLLSRSHDESMALRARIAELEAEHPDWMQRIRRERREAVALAIDSINTQLREHGIDMQFDASAFIQQ